MTQLQQFTTLTNYF